MFIARRCYASRVPGEMLHKILFVFVDRVIEEFNLFLWLILAFILLEIAFGGSGALVAVKFGVFLLQPCCCFRRLSAHVD